MVYRLVATVIGIAGGFLSQRYNKSKPIQYSEAVPSELVFLAATVENPYPTKALVARNIGGIGYQVGRGIALIKGAKS